MYFSCVSSWELERQRDNPRIEHIDCPGLFGHLGVDPEPVWRRVAIMITGTVGDEGELFLFPTEETIQSIAYFSLCFQTHSMDNL